MTTLPNGQPIDMDMLETAMEDADLANRYFLNLVTGQVVFFSDYPGLSEENEDLLEEINGSDDYVAIERIPSHEAYQWMVDFANEMVAPADEHAAEKLSIALDGKGAFRRFKDTLHRIDEKWLQAWYQWRDEQLKAAVEEWLKDVLYVPDALEEIQITTYPEDEEVATKEGSGAFTQDQVRPMQERVTTMLARAGIVLTAREEEQIEVVDFGLGELERTGLELVVYINNERYCAKELVMIPRQTCPQHRHPPLSETNPGKQETFRCRQGTVWLYVEGEPQSTIAAHIPQGSEQYYTVFHEIALHPGGQYTIPPNTWHWFQSGDEGAIVSEFSSPSHDEFDQFLDPRISRIPKIAE